LLPAVLEARLQLPAPEPFRVIEQESAPSLTETVPDGLPPLPETVTATV
jgi:hypothetical protein